MPPTPPDRAALPYRPCVGVMLLNKRNEVFVAQRIDTRAEAWQMPQGGIDKGEEPKAALMRELKEEIGTNNIEVLAECDRWLQYDLPDKLIGQIWNGKYRGQRQKWFAARFLGKDSDINLETEEPEFLTWRWASPQELPHIIVPFKRAMYKELLEEFKEVIGE